MSDNGNSKPNGVEPPSPQPSLRDVAEAAYDEVIDAAEEGDAGPAQEGAGDAQVDDGGQPRDAMGRFAPKQAEPGEAAEETPPSPETITAPDGAKPVDPAPGSNQPPQHWPEQARQMFAAATPQQQSFLLERHTAMERDYQAKVQAARGAVEFAQSVAPYFQDPLIAENLRAANWSPAQAVTELLGFHRRAISPDQNERVGLVREMAQRVLPGIDPAAIFGQSRSGPQAQLSEEHLKDPAIAYFADHVSRTAQEVQALRNQIAGMQQVEAEKANAQAAKVTRWGIDSFAEETDKAGTRLRPDFDALLPQIIELFSANPQRDLREAYETARWMNPQVRQQLIAAERHSVEQRASNQRATQASRLNARGVTSPVGKPGAEAGEKRNLRDALEATADEIGFG